MNVLFVTPEAVPLAKTGGLADVCGALPAALAKEGHDVTVILPFYRMCHNSGLPIRTKGVALDIPTDQGLKKAEVVEARAGTPYQILLVECDDYFNRPGLYVDPISGKDWPDNPQRFSLFAKTILRYFSGLCETPDVIHCHDWQAAFTLAFLARAATFEQTNAFSRTAKIFTIHNIGYPGLFSKDLLPAIGLPWDAFHIEELEYYGKVNPLKGGIIYSDKVTTVSRRYSKEIMTPSFGMGLDGVLRKHAHKLHGILNGVDYTEWNPSTDPYIIRNYDPNNSSGKHDCKASILEIFNIDLKYLVRPLIGTVGRLVDQKGFDIIADAMPELLAMDVSLVFLGAGDPKLEEKFRRIASDNPNRVGVEMGFDNSLAHRIEAGCDMFLMPSRYEPCGLNQMYSLKYGTIPIVHATGGLDDTIQHFSRETLQGNGFKFNEPTPQALISAVAEAVEIYQIDALWNKLMANAFMCDFSWRRSAREYLRLYREAIKGVRPASDF